MSQLTTIHKAVQFIDAHLRTPVTVGDVGDAVGYSLFHFSRTFNRIAHHTPYDYLMRRRVSESASDVLGGGRLIIDIAYDYQFANPETFTRAFRRMFGVTPSDARAQPSSLCREPMPALSVADLAHRSSPAAGKPVAVAEPECLLVALQTLTGKDAEGVDALWQTLIAEMSVQGLAAANYYAVLWETCKTGARGLMAVCATAQGRTAETAAPRPPLLSLRLPQRPAARCPHHGPASAVSLSRAYITHTWLPKAKLWPADPTIVLDYGERPGGAEVPPVALSIGVSAEPHAMGRCSEQA
ncbi:MAG: helix-turn-helix transcriptional regulator [Anaerolineae bacterium]|nr:helix-turn-helix transcriptional regulator [Anaerolineae bacterium]